MFEINKTQTLNCKGNILFFFYTESLVCKVINFILKWPMTFSWLSPFFSESKGKCLHWRIEKEDEISFCRTDVHLFKKMKRRKRIHVGFQMNTRYSRMRIDTKSNMETCTWICYVLSLFENGNIRCTSIWCLWFLYDHE